MNKKETTDIIFNMIELQRRDELNRFELEISLSRHVILDNTWHCDDFCTPFTRLYYVNDGLGYIIHDGKEIQLLPGYAYLIPSDCLFTSYCNDHLEKLYFHVSISTIEKYDLLSNIKEICCVPFDKKSFCELYECYNSNNYFDFLKLKMILYKTIIDCYEKYKFDKVQIKKYSESVRTIMEYIHANPAINLNVKTISKALYISEAKIRKIFKEETGIPIGKYIDDIVFLKAKQMLAKKEIPISEISKELGFCDSFYFSRRFKELNDKTPSEYRKILIME